MKLGHRALCFCVFFACGVGSVGAQAPDGHTIYRERCSPCHGATGRPPQHMLTAYKKLPNFADTAFMRGRSEDSIVAVLRDGAGRDMRSFKNELSAAEMAAVAQFIRSLSGGGAKTP